MNPFKEKALPTSKAFGNWKNMYPKPYDKNEVDPYTKTRIILMNGTEFEANWFSHQFQRHTDNNDLRRELALVREIEKEQQLKISLFKPLDESITEHTISYEQLAVDLTAELAKTVKDENVKAALDFALLEDFDHLYRYSDLLEMEQGIFAERLVGGYTEIMPARPTVAHHRFPKDNVKKCVNNKKADFKTALATMIITAAEQQTMNYYMNVSTLGTNDLARRLYQEIALVEEEHVTQYGSLIDPNGTWLEMLLMHEYCECYLYWSCYMTETDERIKKFWEENLNFEISHLHDAVKLLKKYEKKDPASVIPDGEFPEPVSLHENIDYVRKVLTNTVTFTGDRESYTKIGDLPENADFFSFQKIRNAQVKTSPSHIVIADYIEKQGKDYRFETLKHPLKPLQSRKTDNVTLGRIVGAND